MNLYVQVYIILEYFLCFITANAELKKYFSKCRDGKIRVLKISIENGKLYYILINNFVILCPMEVL